MSTDSRLATTRLPDGVTATPTWGVALRADGTPQHRYRLEWRSPGRTGPVNVIIGMNPSGASEQMADATLRKCWEFCRRWNDGNLLMANVVPYRATSPREMVINVSLGQTNRSNILSRLAGLREQKNLGHIVIAHGTPSLPKMKRAAFNAEAQRLLAYIAEDIGAPILCLGRSKDGSPRHPLMLAYDTPLVPFVSE